ncbi:Trypanosome variant surface glycoprotein (A-type)/Trypanosome variant surface glycoprotein C-terminal domain containing protein, putative [Trypanosoma equiperdum]|uniref:Trypanosome variant surface glycoprotein (A-type)/Trypanosome variant surface glycoprotein C-terminal domain containing protein, putative n=1 Tax=Trypanosoma equiperdum TaxID=5694 RepID=A0A1G4IC17_TRYEQ|nr:Trypanosome variant surface glycoprotein (A-type)/Trypanosome variant surface glycoprotein C-terminal domain containing protein, putative [Trypanosoma equiperdum]
MTKWQQTISALLILIHTVRQQETGDAEAFSGAAMAQLCKLSELLSAVPGDAHNAIAEAHDRTVAALQAAALVRAAETAPCRSKDRVVLAAVAQAAEKCAQDAIHDAKTATTLGTDAVAQAAAMSGHIAEFLTLLHAASETGTTNGYCLTAESAQTITTAADTNLQCRKSTIASTRQKKSYSQTDLTNTGFPQIQTTDAKGSGSAAGKCQLTKKGTAGPAASDVFQAQKAHKLIAGLLTLTTSQADGPTMALTDTTNIAPNGQNQGTEPIHLLFKAVTALKNIQPAVNCGETAESIVKHVVDTGRVQHLLEAIVAVGRQEAQKPPNSDIAKAMLTATAGSDQDQGQKIWDKIKGTAAKEITANKAADKPLNQIETADNHRTTIVYHTQQIAEKLTKLEKDLEGASENQVSKQIADTCNKITNVNERNNKAFCSYNETVAEGDKKCKFDETKASKSGVPVTQPQTGGSETTTEKCKGKEQKDCKDGCKWDGKECKDSSFLSNKEFALIVFAFSFNDFCSNIYDSRYFSNI